MKYNQTEQNGPRKIVCRAVDTGRGVLLFDPNHYIGQNAYRSFMQYCADHFFDRRLNIETL